MYKPFNTVNILEYVKSKKLLKSNDLMVEEIGDGNINQVFRIIDKRDQRTIIIKQSLPYLKIVGDGWSLTRDRVKIEANSLNKFRHYCQDKVPKIFMFDDSMSTIVMEDLGHLLILRKELIKMKRHRKTACMLAEYLGKTLFYHSDVFLSGTEKNKLMIEFSNPELCDITEKLIFTDPYKKKSTNFYAQELEEKVAQIQSNDRLMLDVSILKQKFIINTQSLLHGDLHTGSIFVNDNVIKVFDMEFTCFGPIGFDLGILIGNIILNYVSIKEKKAEENQKQINDFKKYLLKFIEDLYVNFEACFTKLFLEQGNKDYVSIQGFIDYYMKNIFIDTVGFAGCEIIRRVIGLAHVEDIENIENDKARVKVEKLALDIGKNFIINRNEIDDIYDLLDLLKLDAI